MTADDWLLLDAVLVAWRRTRHYYTCHRHQFWLALLIVCLSTSMIIIEWTMAKLLEEMFVAAVQMTKMTRPSNCRWLMVPWTLHDSTCGHLTHHLYLLLHPNSFCVYNCVHVQNFVFVSSLILNWLKVNISIGLKLIITRNLFFFFAFRYFNSSGRRRSWMNDVYIYTYTYILVIFAPKTEMIRMRQTKPILIFENKNHSFYI